MAEDLKTLTPYDRLGGETWVRAFVERFYTLMDTLPEARACRDVHPPNLFNARQKLYEYLTGWLGGPPLFVERHGAPMLRRRHLQVAIDDAEIEGWLVCFERAWAETVRDAEITQQVLPQIVGLARHMKNVL